METGNITLADLAATRPGATRVFLKHKLDFCCGGRRPFGEACAEQGLDADTIFAEIVTAEADPGDVAAWAARPLPELANFIEEHYHSRLRADIPELITMAAKVERVHAQKPSCPHGLANRLQAVHESVLEHLAKEEQVLFPMVRAGYTAQVGGPIRVMEQEHEEHGRNLAYLRELTGDFNAPPEACATWKALYLRLNRFADELMEHIHLENNVLFPRTLCE